MPDLGRLHGLRWFFGLLLSLLALASVAGIGAESDPWVLACALLLLLALWIPAAVSKLPAIIERLALLAVCAHGFADLLLHGADFLPPLIRLLVLWVTWRALFQQRVRASSQLALGALSLVLLSGVLRQDFGFALAIGSFSVAALASLWSIQHCRLVDPVGLSGRSAVAIRRPALADFRDSPLRRVVLFGGGLYVLTLAVALAVFYLLPRFEYGHALPFPQLQASGSQIGLTERLRFGDISQVLQSDERVMRVDTGGERIVGIPYWRMLVLDAYTGDGFEMSEELQADYRELQNHRFGGEHRGSSATEGPWTFYLEGGVGRFLPVPGPFQQLRFQSRQNLRYFEASQVLALPWVPASTLIFRYEGLERSRRLAGPAERTAIPEPQRSLNLDNPTSNALLDRFIQQHRLRGQGQHADLDGFAIALIRALQADRGYSLEVQLPDGDADPLLRWMDAGLSGHCEFYAGAMVLLARAFEVPARLVVGFAGGDWNGFEDYYMVRKRHAHAWVELWDSEMGWVRYDPTPLSRIDAADEDGLDSLAFLRGDRSWEAYIDSLRLLWYRRVIQFDRERQEQLRAQGFERFVGSLERMSAGLTAWSSRWFSLHAQTALELALRWLFLAFLLGNLWLFRSQLNRSRLWLTRCLFGEVKWEQRMRLRAGRLLMGSSRRHQPPHLRRNLLRIRYGPVETWPDPLETFKASRKRSQLKP